MSKKIHVGNLPTEITALDLSKMFGRFGVYTAMVNVRQTAARPCLGIVEVATAAAGASISKG